MVIFWSPDLGHDVRRRSVQCRVLGNEVQQHSDAQNADHDSEQNPHTYFFLTKSVKHDRKASRAALFEDSPIGKANRRRTHSETRHYRGAEHIHSISNVGNYILDSLGPFW